MSILSIIYGTINGLTFGEILFEKWRIVVIGAVQMKNVSPLFSRLNSSLVGRNFWQDVKREKFAGNHYSKSVTKTCAYLRLNV